MVCNDISLSRVNRIKRVMQEYFYDWEKKVTITNLPGAQIGEVNSFSKVIMVNVNIYIIYCIKNTS